MFTLISIVNYPATLQAHSRKEFSLSKKFYLLVSTHKLFYGIFKSPTYTYCVIVCQTILCLCTCLHRLGRRGWVNSTLMEHIMMWSPCVRLTHLVLEQVCQGSRASSSGSAEQLQQTGSSRGAPLERRGGSGLCGWPRGLGEAGLLRCPQEAPRPETAWE